MAQIQISEQLLDRLVRLAEHDYQGVTVEEALERLLSEHQEHVVLEAAADARRRAEESSAG
jgi:hypothetical protein